MESDTDEDLPELQPSEASDGEDVVEEPVASATAQPLDCPAALAHDAETVLVPLPDGHNILLYFCPQTQWWKVGHTVTLEVIELSSSDHSWAVEYDDAGFATVVRDDDAPEHQQAHHVIDLMEVGAFCIDFDGFKEYRHCFVENMQTGNFDNQLELMRKHIIKVARIDGVGTLRQSLKVPVARFNRRKSDGSFFIWDALSLWKLLVYTKPGEYPSKQFYKNYYSWQKMIMALSFRLLRSRSTVADPACTLNGERNLSFPGFTSCSLLAISARLAFGSRAEGGFVDDADQAAWLVFFKRLLAITTAKPFVVTIFMDGNVQYFHPPAHHFKGFRPVPVRFFLSQMEFLEPCQHNTYHNYRDPTLSGVRPSVPHSRSWFLEI